MNWIRKKNKKSDWKNFDDEIPQRWGMSELGNIIYYWVLIKSENGYRIALSKFKEGSFNYVDANSLIKNVVMWKEVEEPIPPVKIR